MEKQRQKPKRARFDKTENNRVGEEKEGQKEEE